MLNIISVQYRIGETSQQANSVVYNFRTGPIGPDRTEGIKFGPDRTRLQLLSAHVASYLLNL